MTLKERLATITGVWEGTYTHLTPRGDVIDHYASRQETRLEGDTWYERIIYRWPNGMANWRRSRSSSSAAPASNPGVGIDAAH